MTKTFFLINTMEEHINQSVNIYMINYTLHVNKVFRDQV